MPASSSPARGPLGRLLDRLYDATAALGAVAMVLLLAMVLLSVTSRQIGFNVAGIDAYAGYMMAGAGFLALAHTLKRGEHIRVTLFLERFGERVARVLDLWCHLAGVFFCGVLAFYSTRLAWQSWKFNDISQGNDATPLWIPQIGMALGAAVLLIAMVDDLVRLIRHKAVPIAAGAEPKHIE